jgi:hypothetical protein
MKTKRTPIIIGAIFAISILLVCIYPFTYGNGNNESLSLNLTIDKTTIVVNESLNASIIIKNIGKTKIRLLDPIYTLSIDLMNINGTRPNYIGIEIKLMRPTIFHLKTLKPNEELIIIYGISSNWELEENISYNIYALLQDDINLILPHWQGKIESDLVSFQVV